jgi:hypothetical protein
MSAARAVGLARTATLTGAIALLADHDLTFNGLDLLTLALFGTAAALLTYAKGR